MNPGLIKTFVAGDDISANRIVTLNGDGNVVPAVDLNAMPIGVVQYGCAAGDRVDVAMSGIVDVEVASDSAAVNPGDPIGAGQYGAANVSYGCAQLAGIALDSANAGDVVPMVLAVQHGANTDPRITIGVPLSEDIESDHLVAIVDGTYKAATAPGDKIVGITVYDARANDCADIAVTGITPVIAGADIAVGDYITADSDGHAVPANTATDNIVGIALCQSPAGQTVDIMVMINHIRPTAPDDTPPGNDEDAEG